ncbi:MAG: hypothetical protein K2F64_04995 [Muribaculaceae bacterium]|nr:hypothetical protein [Muribaculaceae bacterium]
MKAPTTESYNYCTNESRLPNVPNDFDNLENFKKTAWDGLNESNHIRISIPMRRTYRVSNGDVISRVYVDWDVDVEYYDGIPAAPQYVMIQGSELTGTTYYLQFGSDDHPVKKVTFSTDAFSDRSVCQAFVDADPTTTKQMMTGVIYGDYAESKAPVLSTGRTTFGKKDNPLGGDLNGNSFRGMISLTYEPTASLSKVYLFNIGLNIYMEEDPGLSLPVFGSGKGALSFPWSSDGITVPAENENGAFMSEKLYKLVDQLPERIVTEVTPLFTPRYAPEDISEEEQETLAGRDVYYRDNEAEVVFSDDYRHMTIKVPCAGRYRVTMSLDPRWVGYTPSSVSRIYDIFPPVESFELNWNRIVDDQVTVNDWRNDGHRSGHLNFPESRFFTCHYQIEGDPMQIMAEEPETYAEDETEAEDQYYTVPEGFIRHNYNFVDISKGSKMTVCVSKNGAVSYPKTFTYALDPSIPTGVGTIAEDETEAEYYTLTGLRVTANPTPGIYLKRTANGFRKVLVE